jgi:DNA-binding transcriptional LysR family regulator
MEAFRVGFVPGVIPDKWVQRWRERERRLIDLVPVSEVEQLAALDQDRVEICFVRSQSRTDRLHVISLYDETMVVVVPVDHVVTAFDRVSLADLGDEQLLQAPEIVPGWADVARAERRDWPPMTDAQAIESAATGAGIVIVPQSIARLFHRKDLTYRPITDLAPRSVGLAWRTDARDPGIDTFVGIVRGRTERSSRR